MASLSTLAIDHQYDFDGEPFPAVVAPDAALNLESACNWVREHKSVIESQLERSGTVLFRGFPIKTAEDFDAFCEAFDYPSFTYQESLSNAVRINFTPRVFTANEAPKDVEIYLHHEMAQTPISPDKLFFFCASAAEVGGASPICRSDQLYAALKSEQPELAQEFAQKGLKYSLHMPAASDEQSGQGRSWKDTLSVTSVEDAETKLAELGYTWKWQADGSLMTTTPVLPAVRQLENGMEVFYNQLIAAYMGWEGVKENPSKAITFGDGSAIPVEALKLIVDLSKAFTFDVCWQEGDVALIDNKTTMHGRRPFDGEKKRQVLVALTAA